MSAAGGSLALHATYLAAILGLGAAYGTTVLVNWLMALRWRRAHSKRPSLCVRL